MAVLQETIAACLSADCELWTCWQDSMAILHGNKKETMYFFHIFKFGIIWGYLLMGMFFHIDEMGTGTKIFLAFTQSTQDAITSRV
jgi:hypothetical protein